MRACNIGIANAAVFPDPVSARPMMSRPLRASGIADACIGVGDLNLSFWQASQSSGITPSEAKVGESDSLMEGPVDEDMEGSSEGSVEGISVMVMVVTCGRSDLKDFEREGLK